VIAAPHFKPMNCALGVDGDGDGEIDMDRFSPEAAEAREEVIRSFRIHSYPTTLLIDPEGKIISLNQTKKGQPSLRGQDLLKSLDRLLPH